MEAHRMHRRTRSRAGGGRIGLWVIDASADDPALLDDSGGGTVPAGAPPPSGPSPAPAAFDISSPTYAILMDWSASPGATHYDVLAFGTVLASVTDTSYVFSNPSPGVSYHMQTQACSADGCGPPTGVRGCTPGAC
jgi:hypothetical protein